MDIIHCQKYVDMLFLWLWLLAQLSMDISGSTSECMVMKALKNKFKINVIHTWPRCDQKIKVDERYEKTKIQMTLHYGIQSVL